MKIENNDKNSNNIIFIKFYLKNINISYLENEDYIEWEDKSIIYNIN
jgi:hypothetical protein